MDTTIGGFYRLLFDSDSDNDSMLVENSDGGSNGTDGNEDMQDVSIGGDMEVPMQFDTDEFKTFHKDEFMLDAYDSTVMLEPIHGVVSDDVEMQLVPDRTSSIEKAWQRDYGKNQWFCEDIETGPVFVSPSLESPEETKSASGLSSLQTPSLLDHAPSSPDYGSVQTKISTEWDLIDFPAPNLDPTMLVRVQRENVESQVPKPWSASVVRLEGFADPRKLDTCRDEISGVQKDASTGVFIPSYAKVTRGKGPRITELSRAFEAKGFQSYSCNNGRTADNQRLKPSLEEPSQTVVNGSYLHGGVTMARSMCASNSTKLPDVSFSNTGNASGDAKLGPAGPKTSKSFLSSLTSICQPNKKAAVPCKKAGKTLKSTQNGFWSLQNDVEAVKKDLSKKKTSKAKQKTLPSAAHDEFPPLSDSRSIKVAAKSKCLIETTTPSPAHFPAPQQPPVVEICMLIDNANPAISKMLALLHANLRKFWHLAQSSTGQQISISFVTPTWHSGFASGEKEYHDFAARATIYEGHSNQRGHDIAASSLVQAFQQAKRIDWICGSKKIMYVFTNLSLLDEDAKVKWSSNLKKLIPGMPTFYKVLVATWLRDNNALVELFESQRNYLETFPFLDIKKMASPLGKDSLLMDAILLSMRDDFFAKERKITFQEYPATSTVPNENHLHYGAGRFEAIIMTAESPKSIKDCTSNIRHGWKTTRVKVWLNPGSNVALLSCADCEGSYVTREIVVLRSSQVDKLKGKTEQAVDGLYKKLAFVSAVAGFMAQEYNVNYRPAHCARIHFLRDRVIEQKTNTGKRLFFAEDYVDRDGLKQFCGSWGGWNDETIDETLLRFVQTIFKLSGGDLIVAGLQGVFNERENAFFLKTPALLFKSRSKTSTGQDSKNGLEIKGLGNECIGAYMSTCRNGTKEHLAAFNANQQKKKSKSREKENKPEPAASANMFSQALHFLAK